MQAVDKTDVKSKKGYHHGDLRAQLVNATRELVEENGPDRFSVSQACRLAGVSTAAPYRHFGDKQDMLVAVAIEGFGRLRSLMLDYAKEEPDDIVRRIGRIGMAYVHFAQAEPGVFQLMFTDHGRRDDEEAAQAGWGTYEVLLRQVAEYMGKSDIDDQVLARAFPLWTLVHGTSFLLVDAKVKVAEKLPVSVDDMILRATKGLLEA